VWAEAVEQVTPSPLPLTSPLVTALAETGTLDRIPLVGVAQNRAVRRVLDVTRVRSRFSDHREVAQVLRPLGDANG
jgi:hypothetical protein